MADEALSLLNVFDHVEEPDRRQRTGGKADGLGGCAHDMGNVPSARIARTLRTRSDEHDLEAGIVEVGSYRGRRDSTAGGEAAFSSSRKAATASCSDMCAVHPNSARAQLQSMW